MPRRPPTAARAREFGAEGIGLCRTEHMFFDAGADHRGAPDDPGRGRGGPPRRARQAAARTARDFAEIFEVMAGLPVHDPPARSAAARIPAARGSRVRRGRRGGRASASTRSSAARPSCTSSTRCSAIAAAGSGVTYPEIYEMQARAIFEAACDVAAEVRRGADPRGDDPAGRAPRRELELMKAVVDKAAAGGVRREGPRRSTISSAR